MTMRRAPGKRMAIHSRAAAQSLLPQYSTDAEKPRSDLGRDCLTPAARMATAPPEPDVEFKQARLGLIIAGGIAAYVAWYVMRDGSVTGSESLTLSFAFAYLLFSATLCLRIHAAPHTSVPRRV